MTQWLKVCTVLLQDLRKRSEHPCLAADNCLYLSPAPGDCTLSNGPAFMCTHPHTNTHNVKNNKNPFIKYRSCCCFSYGHLISVRRLQSQRWDGDNVASDRDRYIGIEGFDFNISRGRCAWKLYWKNRRKSGSEGQVRNGLESVDNKRANTLGADVGGSFKILPRG